jgi:hypothetical protein
MFTFDSLDGFTPKQFTFALCEDDVIRFGFILAPPLHDGFDP